MALSGTEQLAVVFPAPDIFTCSQSDMERSHLNLVEGCGSRCARGSLHAFPSCRAATEDLCAVGGTWVFLSGSCGIQKTTVLVCKSEFSNTETSPMRGLLELGRIRRLQTKGSVVSH